MVKHVQGLRWHRERGQVVPDAATVSVLIPEPAAGAGQAMGARRIAVCAHEFDQQRPAVKAKVVGGLAAARPE